MGGKRKRIRRERVDHEPPAWPAYGPKLSTVLLEVAEPLREEMDDPSDPVELERVLMLASFAWNVSRTASSGEWARLAAEGAVALGLSTPPDKHGFETLVTDLAARAVALYPDLDAVVAGVQVVRDDHGDLRIRALSRLAL